MEARDREARAGKPYTARKVTFHLPDFIDIVINAGDDRDALGATIGQSLPNWGPVANEGRGRTVAMINLYTDPDSIAARRAQAESVLDAASMKYVLRRRRARPAVDDPPRGRRTTSAPRTSTRSTARTAGAVFGGPIAQVMEELKAQTGALFLIDMPARRRSIISDELASAELRRHDRLGVRPHLAGHVRRPMASARPTPTSPRSRSAS